MKNKKIVKNILIPLFIMICILFIYLNNNIIEVKEYSINSNKISYEFNNFKIAHLSDMHSKSFGKDNIRLVNKIKGINPDIIVITGDMISSNDTNYDSFIDLVKSLNGYSIYYVYGNHEQDGNNEVITNMTNDLIKNNVKVLNNEKVEIIKNNKKINIYGLIYPLRYYQDSREKNSYELTVNDVEKKIGKCDKSEYNILITHNPLYFEIYEKWGADLIFSGHVHGGIMRLPIIGGILSPDVSFLPKYSKGNYQINSSNIIVSAGIGTGRLPIRIFNLPHIPIVTLNRY